MSAIGGKADMPNGSSEGKGESVRPLSQLAFAASHGQKGATVKRLHALTVVQF